MTQAPISDEYECVCGGPVRLINAGLSRDKTEETEHYECDDCEQQRRVKMTVDPARGTVEAKTLEGLRKQ